MHTQNGNSPTNLSGRATVDPSTEHPTKLKRAEAGYRYVWPRPDSSEQKHLYETVFYENDHPGILKKAERELDYWNAVWSLRRELFETTLGPGPHRLLDVGCSGGFLLMGRDYIGQPKVGAECHAMRMQLEKTLIESGHSDVLRRLYDAFAESSMGRTCAVLARKAAAA